MARTENKNTFFEILIPFTKQASSIMEESRKRVMYDKINTAMDLILAQSKATDEVYKYKNNDEVVWFFKTSDRRRKGQIQRSCEQYLKNLIDENRTFSVNAHPKQDFYRHIANLNMGEEFSKVSEPNTSYKGKDLEVFKTKEDWRPWQTQVYDLLFDKQGKVKQPDGRRIISIVDRVGNTGKSSFFKYILYTQNFVKRRDTVGRLTYGNASQLRSGVCRMGDKSIFIIDLARTKGKNDSVPDLLSAIEEVKNGAVTNTMYGAGDTLLFDPPHVIVSSNFALDYNALSSDRWQVYTIGKSYTLEPADAQKLYAEETNKDGEKPRKQLKQS